TADDSPSYGESRVAGVAERVADVVVHPLEGAERDLPGMLQPELAAGYVGDVLDAGLAGHVPAGWHLDSCLDDVLTSLACDFGNGRRNGADAGGDDLPFWGESDQPDLGVGVGAGEGFELVGGFVVVDVAGPVLADDDPTNPVCLLPLLPRRRPRGAFHAGG